MGVTQIVDEKVLSDQTRVVDGQRARKKDL